MAPWLRLGQARCKWHGLKGIPAFLQQNPETELCVQKWQRAVQQTSHTCYVWAELMCKTGNTAAVIKEWRLQAYFRLPTSENTTQGGIVIYKINICSLRCETNMVQKNLHKYYKTACTIVHFWNIALLLPYTLCTSLCPIPQVSSGILDLDMETKRHCGKWTQETKKKDPLCYHCTL